MLFDMLRSITHSLTKINTNLIQDLIHNFLALLFIFQARYVVNCIVHHLLSLIHNVILSFELHGNALEGWKIHLSVHAAEKFGSALHGLHHLLVAAHSLYPRLALGSVRGSGQAYLNAQRNCLELGAHLVELLNISSRPDKVLGLNLDSTHLAILRVLLDILD